jgi:probable F420-dependent oxidoreductase
VKIGIPLFLLRHTQMAAVAQRAEALGFESVWIPEHLVFPARLTTPYPYSEDGEPPFAPDTPILDPLLLLTHIAAATTRIRLGTNIFVLPLRHPIVTARLAMTLDVLSGGRLSLGVGAGWLEEEFRAVGVDFATRGSRLRECVLALRALWTQAEPEFHGRFFDFGPLKFEPKPVQKPHPPILFGGESERAMRRAAALGDGWYGVAHDPNSAREHVARLRALREAEGRAGERFEVTVGHRGGPLDADVLRRYADAGVDRVSVLPWSRGREAEAKLEELAAAVGRAGLADSA